MLMMMMIMTTKTIMMMTMTTTMIEENYRKPHTARIHTNTHTRVHIYINTCLLYFSDFDGVSLNDDHDLVDLFTSLDKLWLKVSQLLLHGRDLRRRRQKLLQAHLVTILSLHHLTGTALDTHMH